MKLFGLTGGIGMGKSAAANLLAERGVSVVDTDLLARCVVELGQPALEEIRNTFGDSVIDPKGHLRRGVLARIVFADAEARQKLEGITHPRIRQLWEEQIKAWREKQASAACVVIPLLFETRVENEFDATICVACSHPTQQRRLQERGWREEQIAQRIAAQFPIEKKIALARFVLWNEGSLEVLGAQLDKVLQF
jgi:dephospho-CoA kinase